MPRYDPELSTTENLARRGLRTADAAGLAPGERAIVDAEGREVTRGRCDDVNAWLMAQDEHEEAR